MFNEILSVILWLVSIPVAWVIAWLVVFKVLTHWIDKDNSAVFDSLKELFKALWPVFLTWGLYGVWVIIALINAVIHVILAVQIGLGA